MKNLRSISSKVIEPLFSLLPPSQDRILVEPFRVTTLDVVSPQEGMSYSWTVTALSPEVTVIDEVPIYYSGPSVDVVFERSPMYSIVLEERTAAAAGGGVADGGAGKEEIVRSSEVEIFCKYVRREIRSLFDEERNQMFDAMKVSEQMSRLVAHRWSLLVLDRWKGVGMTEPSSWVRLCSGAKDTRYALEGRVLIGGTHFLLPWRLLFHPSCPRSWRFCVQNVDVRVSFFHEKKNGNRDNHGSWQCSFLVLYRKSRHAKFCRLFHRNFWTSSPGTQQQKCVGHFGPQDAFQGLL